MVDNQIKLAVSTRNRMPYYIYNNRLENVPFYSNIYSRSLYEGVVITSGMHTIAY